MTTGNVNGTKVLFLVGVPRSGTTWLMALLGQHPEVVSVQQAALIHAIVPLEEWWRSTGGYGKRLVDRLARTEGANSESTSSMHVGDFLSQDSFNSLLRPVTEHVYQNIGAIAGEKSVVVDQTPENLILWTLIRRIVPDAYFLHIVRDPRAVFASQLAASRGWGKEEFSSDPETAARIWQEYMKAANLLRESGANYLELSYEDLRSDTHRKIGEVFAWLNVANEKSIIDAAVHNCSLARMKKAKIGPENFVRRGGVESYRDELTSSQIHCIEYLLADVMKSRGYAPHNENYKAEPTSLKIKRSVRRILKPIFSRESVFVGWAKRVLQKIGG